jgi:hypothetical protein
MHCHYQAAYNTGWFNGAVFAALSILVLAVVVGQARTFWRLMQHDRQRRRQAY